MLHFIPFCMQAAPKVNHRRVTTRNLVAEPLPGVKPKISSNSRIVGRQVATPHSFPFIVALMIDDAYFCGGSILGE